MSDHINISEPNDTRTSDRLDRAKLKAERDFYVSLAEKYSNDLEAIFTRIERGQEVELHYNSGRVIVVRAEPPEKEAP